MWKKGQSGNSHGRPIGSVDRVRAVLDAIQRKADEKGYDGLVKWLARQPDEVLAGMYTKLLPAKLETESATDGALLELIQAKLAAMGKPPVDLPDPEDLA